MKIKVIIAALFAGILSFGAYASPIVDDGVVMDDGPFPAVLECDGLQCFDDTASQPSDFATYFRAPASDIQAPADSVRIYFAAASSPEWRAPACDPKDVPEPGTLLLLAVGLLMLSWRQFAQRR